jgi:hypothetical protein
MVMATYASLSRYGLPMPAWANRGTGCSLKWFQRTGNTGSALGWCLGMR